MNTIFEIVHGSHAYGYFTPESDIDIRGVFLPSPKEILLGTHKKTLNKNIVLPDGKTGDCEHFSLDRYIKLLAEGQTSPVELLFLGEKDLDKAHPVWKYIVDNRYKFISKNFSAFVGFCRAQTSRYSLKGNRIEALKRAIELLEKLARDKGEKSLLGDSSNEIREFVDTYPKDGTVAIITLIDNFHIPHEHLDIISKKAPFHTSILHALNIYKDTLARYGKRAEKAYELGNADYKSLLHALRVADEAVELFDTGRLTFPRPNAQRLLEIKLGKIPMEEILNEVDELINILDTRSKSSELLNEKVDYSFGEKFICEIYKDIIMKGS